MLIDNCPAQPENMTPLKLIFFPPNIISKLRSEDQEIIRNKQNYYRTTILRKSWLAHNTSKAGDVDVEQSIIKILLRGKRKQTR
jgi:hypothetical protein